MLTRALTDEFPPSVRRRGEEYAAQDRVSVEVGSEHSVLALVTGRHEYVVELWRKKDAVLALCGCPHFVDEGACPHVWASLVAAERKGLLRAGDPPARLVLEEHPDADAIRELGLHDADLEEDRAGHVSRPLLPAPVPEREWKRFARELAAARPGDGARGAAEILYALDLELSRELGALVVTLLARGTGKPRRLSLRRDAVSDLADERDRAILAGLAGALVAERRGSLAERTEHVATTFCLERSAHAGLVRLMAESGRLHVREGEASPLEGPVAWDAGAWHARFRMERLPGGDWALHADAASHEERVPASGLRLVAPGFVVLPGLRVSALPEESGHRFLVEERRHGPVRVPAAEAPRAAGTLLAATGVPPLDAPAELALQRRAEPPRPRLVVRRFGARETLLAGELSFEYDGLRVDEDAREGALVDHVRRLVLARDPDAESSARALLQELRVRPPKITDSVARPWLLSARRLSEIVGRLVREGWLVEAEGRRQRAPGRVTLRAESAGDWLELHGEADFEGVSCALPEILRAVERGASTVRLSDGTSGLLPLDWLRAHRPWLSLGKLRKDHVRFAASQAALLDALLAGDPLATAGAGFDALRRRLRAFESVAPDPQPPGFAGTLRDYQRAGLGWMRFLREVGFGGCLADDMGTGKTAQVLGMLAARHAELRPAQRRPSLVVVPRSLVFNWRQEAARFTPGLRVVDHSGASRRLDDVADADVVLCTYGTLRRDVALLREIELDYAILDEAQAIKNAGTSAAKAARLLRARHRLALSGTPIENHLGELWSLFEFLNPGMLGSASAFRPAAERPADVPASDRATLARALRPFLLRRTKQQVAKELPARTEATLRFALSPPHRRQYEELRTHYRRELLGQATSGRIDAASRMHVLEALLRLRQLACHPGLVDPARRGEPSAKLDLLFDRLEELAAEGHKALVFSQFTTLLRIVRDGLKPRGIRHEYLDGTTVDRQERVARFQADDDCRAFLVSLKAGGTGLNLTSADYVFLLDPWWNPAAEAQAIDRAHRIGQVRSVVAYRLIAADTVEERVLELQQGKRELAGSLLGDGTTLPAELRREDLELLLR